MKFYWFEKVFGWQMTGFVGKDNSWFFGYSKILKEKQSDN